MRVTALIIALFFSYSGAFQNAFLVDRKSSTLTTLREGVAARASNENENRIVDIPRRRRLLKSVTAFSLLPLVAPFVGPGEASAVTPTGPEDGLLPDLPPEAQRSYLQYRIPLQIFADFYVFDFQRLVEDTDSWGEVGQLYRVNNNRGQGQPSRIEREFTNPIRILGLSMPPDIADAMRDSQFKFEKAMSQVSKATAGVRRDLPVEIDKNAIQTAKSSWEEGRLALNECFETINEATGLKEMKTIPPAGPDQTKEYGRSPGQYFNLVKKTKLCQNRGGPALSQAWGQLMVSGYLQDSCGIPDLNEYFYQS